MSLSQFVVLAECNLSARLFSLFLFLLITPPLPLPYSQLSSHWRAVWTWLPANATNVEVVNCDGRQPQRQTLHLRPCNRLFLKLSCCLFRRLKVPENLAENRGKARSPQTGATYYSHSQRHENELHSESVKRRGEERCTGHNSHIQY